MSNGELAVKIRAATVADIENLASVQLRSALAGFSHIFPESIAKPIHADLEEEWAALVADPRTMVAAALVDGAFVGVLAAGPDEDHDKGTDCILLKLYVAPTHFGRGVGSLLYERAIDWFAASGCKRARLWVLEHNTRALQMYERRGWVRQSWLRSDWPGSGIDEIGYVLDLGDFTRP